MNLELFITHLLELVLREFVVPTLLPLFRNLNARTMIPQ
jgi:hypothetical protein